MVVEIVGVVYGVLVGNGVRLPGENIGVGEGPVFDLSEKADEVNDLGLPGPEKGAAVVGLDNG